MNNKEAIANLNQIYGMVSTDIQRSLDVAFKCMEERPQGKWEHDKLFGECAYVCSFCHTIWTSSKIQNMHYCPTCGAYMNCEEQENSQKESNNVSWDKSSSEQEESEKSNNTTFNGIYDLNDGIADPTYINEFVDCSDLGIYP